MSPDDDKPASDWLTHQWVVAGIVSASSRFIPIPFVDEIVRDQCRRFAVSRTLVSHNSDVSLESLRPYYASGGGCLHGCAGLVVKAPLKLLLFPFRKFISIVTSVRGVPLEIMRMVLLGRTLDRFLRDKKLREDPAMAVAMRSAFEDAFVRMDFRVIRAAMADALSGVKGWKSAATQSAREMAGPRDVVEKGLEASNDVDQGATEVQKVLNRPEALSLFVEFDRRFDNAMEQLA